MWCQVPAGQPASPAQGAAAEPGTCIFRPHQLSVGCGAHDRADLISTVQGLPAPAGHCHGEVRQLVLVLGPGLTSFVGHPSLTQLVDHAYHVDQQVLCFVAAQLDGEQLLLLPDQNNLAVQLITTGNVRVCGLVLHNMSERLDTLLVTQHGQGLLTAFIQSATNV